MPEFEIRTSLRARPADCFDLIRDAGVSGALGVDGNAPGIVAVGQIVRFETRLFGIRSAMSVKVIEARRPDSFVDEMIDGPFRRFRHVHEFRPDGDGTTLVDTVKWETPFGPLGKLADLIAIRHLLMRQVTIRNKALKLRTGSVPQ